MKTNLFLVSLTLFIAPALVQAEARDPRERSWAYVTDMKQSGASMRGYRAEEVLADMGPTAFAAVTKAYGELPFTKGFPTEDDKITYSAHLGGLMEHYNAKHENEFKKHFTKKSTCAAAAVLAQKWMDIEHVMPVSEILENVVNPNNFNLLVQALDSYKAPAFDPIGGPDQMLATIKVLLPNGDSHDLMQTYISLAKLDRQENLKNNAEAKAAIKEIQETILKMVEVNRGINRNKCPLYKGPSLDRSERANRVAPEAAPESTR